MTFPVVRDTIGLGLSSGICSFVGLVAFVVLFIDETKGRALQDMSRAAEAGATA